MAARMETHLSTSPACGAGIEIAQRVVSLENSDKEQWDAIDRMQNRLPVWGSLLLTLMGTMLGSALTYAALAARLAGK